MISEKIVLAAAKVATALSRGVLDDKAFRASTGVKQLSFKDPEGKKKFGYTVLEQNPQRTSVGAKLAREGHKTYNVRDNDENRLIGRIDLDDRHFEEFPVVPGPSVAVDMNEVDKALGGESFNPEEISIGSRSAGVPVNRPDSMPGTMQPEPRRDWQAPEVQPQGSNQRSSDQRLPESPKGSDWFTNDLGGGKKAA